MSLIKCPKCEKEISSKAQTCPNCGYLVANIKANKDKTKDENSPNAINAFFEKHSQPNKFWGLLILSISVSPVFPVFSGFCLVLWFAWISFYFEHRKNNHTETESKKNFETTPIFPNKDIKTDDSKSDKFFKAFGIIFVFLIIISAITNTKDNVSTNNKKDNAQSTSDEKNLSVETSESCKQLKSLLAYRIDDAVMCYNFSEGMNTVINVGKAASRMASENATTVSYGPIEEVYENFRGVSKLIGVAILGEEKLETASMSLSEKQLMHIKSIGQNEEELHAYREREAKNCIELFSFFNKQRLDLKMNEKEVAKCMQNK